MEISEIIYMEYSCEECEKIRTEYNDLKLKREEAISKLEETAHKICGLIQDTFPGSYWNHKVWEDWGRLDDKVDDVICLNDERYKNISSARLNLWNKNFQIESGTFYANISKYLVTLWKQDLKKINELQKQADSLLFRCTHLNSNSTKK